MIDRSLFLIGWVFVSWLAIQTLPITALVYSPHDVEIKGAQVTLIREFPMDRWFDWRPRISYIEMVKPLTPGHNGGQDCDATGQPRVYDDRNPTGSWTINWAAPCLSDPAGYTWHAFWFWNIGALRVGGVDLSKTIVRNPCQFRVSQAGVIHGPDSPHWAQTSTDRCFATRAEAEAAVE